MWFRRDFVQTQMAFSSLLCSQQVYTIKNRTRKYCTTFKKLFCLCFRHGTDRISKYSATHTAWNPSSELQAPYLCEGEGASNCGTVLSSLTGEYKPLISWNRKSCYSKADRTWIVGTVLYSVFTWFLVFQADDWLYLLLFNTHLEVFTVPEETLGFDPPAFSFQPHFRNLTTTVLFAPKEAVLELILKKKKPTQLF